MSDSLPSSTQPLPPGVLAGGDPFIGQRVGEYVVEAPLAAGGMGLVYRAVHPIIGRRVAVKVVRPEMGSDKEQADRFLKEAQALSAIKHHGIIEVIGFGNLPDGRQYMVMEFLEGESLESVLAREGPLGAAQALPLVDEILSALSAAHTAGVVHRDLKPSNVFISRQTSGDRTVKVLDFGLAKQTPVVLSDVPGDVAPKSSLMAGTPEYIAPEQARGLVATAQTDLYCVGVMLYEMLCGQLPFKAENVAQLMTKHIVEAPPRLSGQLPSLEELVATLLAKDPSQRPPSADAARQSVLGIIRELGESSTLAGPRPLPLTVPSASASHVTTSKLPERGSLPTQPFPPERRTPRLWWLLLILLFLLGGGLTLWVLKPGPNSEPAVDLPPPARFEPVVAAPLMPASPPLPKPTPERARPTDDSPLEPAPLDPSKPKRMHPNHPVIIAVADDCEPDEAWKKGEAEFALKLENTYRQDVEAAGKIPDNRALETLAALRSRIAETDNPTQCARLRAALSRWQLKNIAPAKSP